MLSTPLLSRTAALERVAAFAEDHDRAGAGAFPEASWAALRAAGIPTAGVDGPLDPVAELELVRAVAFADLCVGRILDGHLNGVQRLRVQVDPRIAAPELERVRAGRLRLAVWGADPVGDEGPPAALSALGGAATLSGVKVFCSGAGGAERAFVLTRGPGGDAPGRLAYVDVSGPETSVDPTWFNGAGMRGSASHRVLFDRAPVLWQAPERGALLLDPWFSGDALRTAASWVGGAQAAAEDALATLRRKGPPGELEALAAGRILTARGTLALWLAEAGRRLEAAFAAAALIGDGPRGLVLGAPAAPGAQPAAGSAEGTPRASAELRAFSAHARDAIAGATRALLDEATRACGSRALATGTPLERAQRDLQTYLLQHRLEPIVARAGRAALEAGG